MVEHKMEQQQQEAHSILNVLIAIARTYGEGCIIFDKEFIKHKAVIDNNNMSEQDMLKLLWLVEYFAQRSFIHDYTFTAYSIMALENPVIKNNKHMLAIVDTLKIQIEKCKTFTHDAMLYRVESITTSLDPVYSALLQHNHGIFNKMRNDIDSVSSEELINSCVAITMYIRKTYPHVSILDGEKK